MRVVLERLGLELVVPPNALGLNRARVDTSDPFVLERLLSSVDVEDTETLRTLFAALEPVGVDRRSDGSILTALVDHIRWGRVGVFELERLSASVREEELEEEHQPDVETRHWIEIQLVDEIGAPVQNARYQITLPDGKIREGRTNSKGVVRFDGIEPGVCDFSFTGLDEEAWEPA
jgi:hypothetical protein